MAKKKYSYDYPRPAVTVDAVVLTPEPRPQVLLIRRKRPPYPGCWALPGGFVEMEETLEAAVHRELFEETGIRIKRLEQFHTFGDPGRDPRGRTISVVYLGKVNAGAVNPRAADDAAEVEWHRLDRLPELAFDHARILQQVRKWLAKDKSN